MNPGPDSIPIEVDSTPNQPFSVWRIRVGLLGTLAGFLVLAVGTRPGFFGLDRSPVIGFVQVAVFLVGLGLICVGGYICLVALWKGLPTSISADIGVRLVATGFLIAVFAGMADVFGFGSHPLPGVPYFGPLQALGVGVGQAVIAIGLLLLIPYQRLRSH